MLEKNFRQILKNRQNTKTSIPYFKTVKIEIRDYSTGTIAFKHIFQ